MILHIRRIVLAYRLARLSNHPLSLQLGQYYRTKDELRDVNRKIRRAIRNR